MDLSLDFNKMTIAERLQAEENRARFRSKFPTKVHFWEEYRRFEIEYKYRKSEFVPNWNMKGHQLIHYLRDHIKEFEIDNIVKINSINKQCNEKGGMSYKQERLIRVLAMKHYKEFK